MTIGKIQISQTLKKAKRALREDPSISPSFRSLVEVLVLIIELLVDRLGLNSTNSSKPPSQDPNRPRGSRKKTTAERRQPGGQPGHEGSTLTPVDNPNEIVELKIDRRRLPRDQYQRVGFESRQVIDIEVSRKVTEYKAEIVQDSQGRQWVAHFPAGVTRPVQYGHALKAQSVYLSQHQLIPYERIQDYFAHQCGLPISTGTLVTFNREAFERLETFEAIVKRRLILQELLHADETGLNVNGSRFWLHCLSNSKWTYFFPHPKRGGQAMETMGVLPSFHGILCHDHWKPYFAFQCEHALCNAHHLRELDRAWEQDGQAWAEQMHELLVEMNDATRQAGGRLSQTTAQRFRRRFREVLKQGDRECPPPDPKDPNTKGRLAKSKSRNLLERLRKSINETLRFLTDERVPFTNNQGENDIRMTKVQQKISGCFRSFEGAQIFCRVRSYLSTCLKHNIQPTEALKLLFSGRLPDFIHKLE